jgi:hypothetical protein
MLPCIIYIVVVTCVLVEHLSYYLGNAKAG